jgi:hypothetical protein
MGGDEIQTFMSYLVTERKVPVAYKRALCTLLFLYKRALNTEVLRFDGVNRPRRPARRRSALTQGRRCFCTDERPI